MSMFAIAKRYVLSLSILLLTACGTPPTRPALIVYDLGNPPPLTLQNSSLLTGLDVFSSVWLVGDDMHYRFGSGAVSQRSTYAESRWAAPPAELYAMQLRRMLVEGHTGSCRLHIDIDDFVQHFSSPQTSQMVLSGRIKLLTNKVDEVVARLSFTLTHPAPSADARGGVAAAQAMLPRLRQELDQWLGELQQASESSGPTLKQRCSAR